MTENVLDGRDFAELILRDLINEGYGGKELFDEFNINVHNLRIRVHGQTGYVPIYFEFISLYYKELLT